MSQEIPWSRTLGARLGGIALVLLVVSLLLVGASFYTLSSLQGDAASLTLYTRGQMYSYQILYLVQVLAALGLVFWVGRGVVRRTHALARTAERIAGGELGASVEVSGGDELAALGQTFNAMTANLRTKIEGEKQRRKHGEKLLDHIRE